LAVSAVVVGLCYLWGQVMHAADNALRPESRVAEVTVYGKRCYVEDDPYYWLSYAREMAETGQWRIRHTYIDNTPFGRQVHWSQSVSWLLILFGIVSYWLTGEPMSGAIETASIWVNPVLLVIVTIGFSWLICRRMGAVAAAFFAITLVSVATVQWTYHPFRPDHQGLHVAFGFGAMLCLVLGGMGWVEAGATDARSVVSYFRPLTLPDAPQARRYFIAAGVFTGLGLWIGATVHFFNVAAMTGGCLLLVCLMPKRSGTAEQCSYIPELWRWWAVPAAMTGFVFYLAEYFPNHLEIRLDVNSLPFLVTLLCVGELMVTLTRWRLGMRMINVYSWVKIAVLALGAALVPMLFVLGPTAWHSMHDVEIVRLSKFISESQTFSSFQKGDPLTGWLRAFGLLPLFLIGALWLTRPQRSRLYEWAALWMSFCVCLVYLLLTLWQIRWAGIYAVTNIWLMTLVGHVAWRNVSVKQPARDFLMPATVAGALILAQAAYFIHREYSSLAPIVRGTGLLEDIVDATMKKHLAQGLAAMSNGQPLRIICEPDLGGALYYFGRNTAVASTYWENLQGLHDATDFFTDHGDTVAREIARKRGLTHVLVSDGEQPSVTFNYIRTGSMSEKDAQSTLLSRLRQGKTDTLPSWIVRDETLTAVGRRQFRYHGASGSMAIDSRVTVYRLEPGNAQQ
jgi:hypothetical protein